MKKYLFVLFITLSVLYIATSQKINNVEIVELNGFTVGQNIKWCDVSDVQGLKEKTIILWLYKNRYIEEDRRVFEFGNSKKPATNGHELFTIFSNDSREGGDIVVFSSWSHQLAKWKTTNKPFVINSLSMITITYDASNVINDPVIYFNGKSQSIIKMFSPKGEWLSTGADGIAIGSNTSLGKTIDGKIYQLLIYNRILSATEIAEAYASKLAIPTWRGLAFAPQLYSVSENNKCQ